MTDLGNKKLAMTDYKLPDPEGIVWNDASGSYVCTSDFRADQMQQAYQAGAEAAREDITIAYMSGYHKGRDSMKAEAVKVCEKWHDSLASEPEMLKIAEEIRGLKSDRELLELGAKAAGIEYRHGYYICSPIARELDTPVPVLPKNSFYRFKEIFK